MLIFNVLLLDYSVFQDYLFYVIVFYRFLLNSFKIKYLYFLLISD